MDRIPPTSGMVAQNRSRSFSVVCTDYLQLAILERGDQGLIRATKGDDRFSQNCKICDYLKLSKIYLILILIPLLLCAGNYFVFQLNWMFRRNSNKVNTPCGPALKVVDRISCKPSIHLYDEGASTVHMSYKYEVFLDAI